MVVYIANALELFNMTDDIYIHVDKDHPRVGDENQYVF